MGFWDRMKEIVEKGVETSKDMLGKAADKAKELGEKGVLKFEIMQLETTAQKKLTQLGTHVYELLVKKSEPTVTRESAGVKEAIAELLAIEAKIDAKELELKTK